MAAHKLLLKQAGLTAVDAARVMGEGVRKLRFNKSMAKVALSAEATELVAPIPSVKTFRLGYMMDDVGRVAGSKHMVFCPEKMRWTLTPQADCEHVLAALDTRLRHARDGLCPKADTISMILMPGAGDITDFAAGADVILVFERMLPEGAPKNAVYHNVPFPVM